MNRILTTIRETNDLTRINTFINVLNKPFKYTDPSGWEGEEDDEGKDKKDKKNHQDGGGVVLIIPVSVYQYCMWALNSMPDNSVRSISYQNGQPGTYYQWDPENGITGTSKQPFGMIGPGGRFYVWDPVSIGGNSINIKSSPEAWIWTRWDPVDSWREVSIKNDNDSKKEDSIDPFKYPGYQNEIRDYLNDWTKPRGPFKYLQNPGFIDGYQDGSANAKLSHYIIYSIMGDLDSMHWKYNHSAEGVKNNSKDNIIIIDENIFREIYNEFWEGINNIENWFSPQHYK